MNLPLINAAALIVGSDFHLLDHIAPLADLFQIPLIATEEKTVSLAKTYYPHVHVEYEVDIEFKLASLGQRFDTLFQCQYWTPQLKTLFKELHKKEMRLIFCPHGQSDKGRGASTLSLYAEQEIVLLYGELLIQMLKELTIWPSISRYALIGNYRLFHYLRHQVFYDTLAEREIFSHFSKQKTLLYAPTWQDADQSSSFFHKIPTLLSQLPPHWNLLIKAHPRLEEKDPARFYALSHLIAKQTNAFLITEFPPVYPLLNKADAYLGDVSSVGYDFLKFQRPMFFFPHASLPPGRLQSCGSILDNDSPIFSFIEANMNNKYEMQQRELYEFAFGKQQEDTALRGKVFTFLR